MGPKFLDTDFQQVILAWLAQWEAETGTQVPGTSLLRHVFTVAAYREILLRTLANEAAGQSFLQYAAGSNLDLIGDMFGVTRLASQAAQCNLQFTFSPAVAVDYTIPAGTRVQSSDGLAIFATTEAVTIESGDTTVDVLGEATVGGTDANGIPVGAVNVLLDTLAITPATVGNTTTTEGGGDSEEDDRYRARIAASVTQPSTAGSAAMYRALALGYNSEIVSVDVHSPSPGEVQIFPLLAGGEIPDEVFCGELQTYLSDDEIKPICDTVTVSPPSASEFALTVRLDFRASEAQQQTTTLAEAERLCEEWAAVRIEQLGRDIVPEEIVDLCQGLPGVYRVRVLSPAWTQVGVGHFPKCTSIDVQIGNEYDEVG